MPKKVKIERESPEEQDTAVEIEYLPDPAEKEDDRGDRKTGKGPAGEKALRSKLQKKEEEIKMLKNEVEGLKEDYLRMAAEKDNLRKRLEREKDDFFRYALSDLLKEFLAVLDNFERALHSHKTDEGESLIQGLELIYKQFMDVLKRQGVSPIEKKDNTFDPRVEQAFMTEESDEVDEPTVGEEYQKGYMLHDRLLRPALVKVVLPAKKQAEEDK
jgi:molecular chaperone GrpE